MHRTFCLFLVPEHWACRKIPKTITFTTQLLAHNDPPIGLCGVWCVVGASFAWCLDLVGRRSSDVAHGHAQACVRDGANTEQLPIKNVSHKKPLFATLSQAELPDALVLVADARLEERLDAVVELLLARADLLLGELADVW